MNPHKLALTAHGVTTLLSDPLANPKIAKNGKLGVLAAPLHLAPARLSGYETCPQRSAGCTAGCLNTAGNPAYAEGKAKARNARTKLYFEARPVFMAQLVKEIAALVRRAERAQMEPAVRLNVTSDIAWERVPCVVDGVQHRSVMDAFPDVQFYDYTKVNKRAIAAALDAGWPVNYHLTFSLTEANDEQAARVLQVGGNVAVAFHAKRGKPLPASFMGRPVIDGDEHDFRPADVAGVIVGLRAKGQAIGDTSGFVR